MFGHRNAQQGQTSKEMEAICNVKAVPQFDFLGWLETVASNGRQDEGAGSTQSSQTHKIVIVASQFTETEALIDGIGGFDDGVAGALTITLPTKQQQQ